MTTQFPLVSVLMPVFNGMPWLPAAVDSILKQTFTDFEFIIVDDCSTDESGSFLKSLSDPRIKLITLPLNSGVTGALQAGMALVSGTYVARLDADDIAKPNRLQTQIDYLVKHSEVGLLGSGYEVISAEGNSVPHTNKEKNDLEIRWELLFKNPFFHSTVMFRTTLVRRHQLSYSRKHAEDYQLWIDLLKHCKGFILKDALIFYRTHQQSWTHTRKTEQDKAGEEIYTRELAALVKVPGDAAGFVAWARGKASAGDMLESYVSTYLSLLRNFASLQGEGAKQFYLKRLGALKRRLSLRQFLRWDIISLYLKAAF